MKNQIWKTLLMQYALGGIYVFGVLIWDTRIALSALVGCVASLVPNTYYSIRMAKQANNDDATQWLGFAYRTEFAKLLMTGMIFFLIFNADREWDPLVLFAGFILIQMSSSLIPLVFKGN